MEKPKTFCEQILNHLRTAAREVLEKFAEPDAVIIVVPWRVGQVDFPYGIIVQRPEDLNTSLRAAGYLEQLRKMTQFVAVNLLEQPYQALVDDLKKVIHEQEFKIQQLTQEKQEGS